MSSDAEQRCGEPREVARSCGRRLAGRSLFQQLVGLSRDDD